MPDLPDVSCLDGALHRPHPAHDWQPEPGMRPVRCAGHPCDCPNPPLHDATCPATADLWRGVAPGGAEPVTSTLGNPKPGTLDVAAGDCLFCRRDDPAANRIIAENGTCFARWDNYPAAEGHVEIAPKRHVESFFDLTREELIDAVALLHDARPIINAEHGDVHGYTIGINEGRAAGRTIDHLHIHLIPRRHGDVPDPRGGVRRIFPGDDPDRWAADPQHPDTRSRMELCGASIIDPVGGALGPCILRHQHDGPVHKAASGATWWPIASNNPPTSNDRGGCDLGCDHGDPCTDCSADAQDAELTAAEARALVDELGYDLYRAQDTLDLVGECCDTADRNARPITTSDVRKWLKGTRCGRQLLAEGVNPGPDDTDLTERDIDQMMANGTAVQIVTGPQSACASEIRARLVDAITSEMHSSKGPSGVIPRIAEAVLAMRDEELERLQTQLTVMTTAHGKVADYSRRLEAAAQAQFTPPPPGSTAEQLPDTVLARISVLPYLSTACQAAALLDDASIRNDGVDDELAAWSERMHSRCRINNKFTGQLCDCPHHTRRDSNGGTAP